MTREVHADVKAVLATGNFTMVNLVKLDVGAGSPESPLYITDAQFPVTYDGNIYLSSGHLLKIGDVSENTTMQVGTLRIELSAVEQTFVSLFLSGDRVDDRVLYYKAFLDGTRAIIGDPVLYFDGNISGFKINERGARSSLTLDVASHWANFDTISGRKTNSNSVQIHFPNDLGFEYAAHNVRDILWGRT